MKTIPNTHLELQFWEKNQLVAGIDEVGRGALAGPVVAAAVILPPFFRNSLVNDSKMLSAKRRDILFDEIKEQCVSFGVGSQDALVIETINILQATMKAMQKSVAGLNPQPSFLLVDGNYFRHEHLPFATIIGGDAICLSISAASIIAKVSRDRWMCEVADVQFPEYGFAKHKGYGTKQHISAIKKYGICPLHRRTFLVKILYE